MPRRIEIKLALPVVLPLIELIQHQADLLGSTDQTLSQDEAMRRQINLLEAQRLLALFHPRFADTGRISIDETANATVLRACSLIRLQLRANALSAISDETLEGPGLNADLFTGEERRNVTCYMFLATLQELLLKHFPVRGFLWSLEWRDLFSAISKFFSNRRRLPEPAVTLSSTPGSADASDVWQVVVQNDPVNLMSYVTAVLQNVFGLSEKIAKQRMREVHELKSSKVWEGPKEKAEAYVRSLQSWHLRAALRST